MVGGKVKSVLDCGSRVWINCRSTTCYRRKPPGCLGENCPHDECTIYVERNDNSLKIKAGDTVWWQGRNAMWTPSENAYHHDDDEPRGGAGTRFDIEIPRLGYSGVNHPAQALIESSYRKEPQP